LKSDNYERSLKTERPGTPQLIAQKGIAMAISPIDKELLRYFVQLNDFQKKSLLEFIKSFLKNEDMLGGQTIDQYNQELDQAMERISRSEFTSLEMLEREMKSW
jgi:hypothetical protein